MPPGLVLNKFDLDFPTTLFFFFVVVVASTVDGIVSLGEGAVANGGRIVVENELKHMETEMGVLYFRSQNFNSADPRDGDFVTRRSRLQ